VPHNGPKNSIAIDLLAQHVSTEIYKRGANLARQPSTKKEKRERKLKAPAATTAAPAAATDSTAPASSIPAPESN
jgi:hypothetical protein